MGLHVDYHPVTEVSEILKLAMPVCYVVVQDDYHLREFEIRLVLGSGVVCVEGRRGESRWYEGFSTVPKYRSRRSILTNVLEILVCL